MYEKSYTDKTRQDKISSKYIKENMINFYLC